MDIHNYRKRVEQAKVRFKEYKDSEVVIAFLNHPKTNGLTDARICFFCFKALIFASLTIVICSVGLSLL